MLDKINSVSYGNGLGVGPRMELSSVIQLAASALNISQLPACALSCITSTCDATNATCICAHEGYSTDMDACMFKSCRLSDALFSKNLTTTFCDLPVRDKGLEFKVINFILGGLACVLVVLRIFFKQYFSASKKLGLDDWAILVAMLIGIASVIVQVFFLTPNGLGKDIWTMEIPTLLLFGHYFYVMEILYLTLITLIKVSLSLFYLNIFPGQTIRRLLWITVAFHVACGIAFITKTVLQCTPVDYNWNKFDDDPTTNGHCIDINASGWANGVIGVVADIWLFALPLTQLKRLRLHWKKKVGAAIMFLTGGIVTIVSMLRLKSLIHFANSWNPTWDQWSVVFWSTIEVTVGFICICLPALRLMLMRMYPRAFETDSYRTSCTVSSNRYRHNSISHIDDGESEIDSAGYSQSNLVPAYRRASLKDEDGELGIGSGKVRIRSMQAMPVDDNNIELAAKDPESTTRPPRK